MSRTYAVDISGYQGTCLTAYHKAGAKDVFIKITEGTGYFNPKARAQIKSGHANHMFIHAYHFANFGNSVSRAKSEARFAIKRAKQLGISKKRYLALDWERGNNYVDGSAGANTRAIKAFMHEVHKAGWKVMLYSGASLLRNNVNTRAIVKTYGTCLWAASYATMGRIDTPDFGYFPSMDGVAVWQFTDNWRGLYVDGDIALIALHETSKKKAKKPAPKKKAKAKPKKAAIVYAPIINNNPNWKIALRDGKGNLTGKYINTNSNWKVISEKNIGGRKYFKLGTDKQWVPAQYLKVVKYK